jgi:hypothetical protein
VVEVVHEAVGVVVDASTCCRRKEHQDVMLTVRGSLPPPGLVAGVCAFPHPLAMAPGCALVAQLHTQVDYRIRLGLCDLHDQ